MGGKSYRCADHCLMSSNSFFCPWDETLGSGPHPQPLNPVLFPLSVKPKVALNS